MIAYKLFKKRKDGTYGPLFINRKQKIQKGVLYGAESHPTTGYAYRPGWHCCNSPSAPHLSSKDRVWCKVDIQDYTKHVRPVNQGGVWYTANFMSIIEEL